MPKIKKIHHVAYRCHDAKETADWYQKHLHMELTVAISEDHVPSTKAADPYMHIFLDAGMGNVLAFFEITGSPKMGRDENTPLWVQHIAFEVEGHKDLLSFKSHLEENDIEVLGITNHTIFQSIYFFDPNGHRIELAYNTSTKEQRERLKKVVKPMLEEWSKTKRPPKHADWLHK